VILEEKQQSALVSQASPPINFGGGGFLFCSFF
jgi:hypothetical protein